MNLSSAPLLDVSIGNRETTRAGCPRLTSNASQRRVPIESGPLQIEGLGEKEDTIVVVRGVRVILTRRREDLRG